MALTIGVHEKWTAPDNGRNPTQILERFPGASIGRAFVNDIQPTGTDLQPKLLNVLQPYLDADTPVIYVSVKTHLADTRQGLWNAHFQEVGAYLQQLMTENDCVIKLIWWPEPENDMPGTAFVHAFNKVRQNVKVGGPNVLVVYAALAYQWRPASTTTANPADWLVTADEYAIDVYSGRTFPLDRILPEHPGFVRWAQQLLPAGAPFTVTERGFETPSTTDPLEKFDLRNATIEREFEWLRTNPNGMRCQAYVYWNSSGTEQAAGLRLDPTGEATLAALIQPSAETPPEPPTTGELAEAYQQGYEAGYQAAREEQQAAIEAARAEGMTLGRQQGRNEGERATKRAMVLDYQQRMNALVVNYAHTE